LFVSSTALLCIDCEDFALAPPVDFANQLLVTERAGIGLTVFPFVLITKLNDPLPAIKDDVQQQ
jgi:hypothetical protein